ncbi:hypothetical protein [Kutzneria kofuensis]|uniref:DUF2637 domain-containing protein n=1 Tax=Kutzneria kofuensis TaxID=103725 RepID=A0A7W9NFG6_9PSEU|nr:hypothetical protein [Kutzneria kofuensis]MBB5890675.1 hypothetical protein [Kutzneria kofuensis]
MLRRKNTEPSTPEETARVRKLRAELHEAHDLHALSEDPLRHIVALERIRVSVTRSMWWFLAAGLGFTTAGVHDFLAGDKPISDPMWWGCWLVEPALAGLLITLLRWESEMLSREVAIPSGRPGKTTGPVQWLKKVLLGSTLVMNVVPTLWPRAGSGEQVTPGSVFVHIVIPIVVFLVAEVMPLIQTGFTRAKERHTPRANATDTTPASAREGKPRLPLTPTAPAVQPVPDTPPAPAQPAVATTAAPSRSAIPDAMRTKLADLRANLGRSLTPEDIRSALRVPEGYAAQLAASLADAA